MANRDDPLYAERLSANFTRWEFRCRGEDCCGGAAPADSRLVNGLQRLRNSLPDKHRAKGITINCAFRCPVHNRAIGSEDSSEHPKARAADLATPDGMTVDEFADLAEAVPEFAQGGIGKYEWGIHVDVRLEAQPARWDKR
jgi:uncharacterized protein YcbK (DUF882 family)